MAKVISESSFNEEVINSDVPVMVDFFATWCAPCISLAPVLDEISDDISGKAKVLKIDIDQAPELTKKFNVKKIPTIAYFKNGTLVDQMIGVHSKDVMKQKLETLL